MKTQIASALVVVSALIVVGAFTAQNGHAQDRRLSDVLSHQADVEVAQGSGLSRLVLPAHVIEQCSQGLADLRLFDEQGQVVPYFVDGGARYRGSLRQSRRIAAPPLNVQQLRRRRSGAPPPAGADEYVEAMDFRIPPSPSAGPPSAGPPSAGLGWKLVLSSARARFVRGYELSWLSSQRGKQRPSVRGTFFRLDSPRREKLEIAVPREWRAGRVQLRFVGYDGFIEPTVTFVTNFEPASPEMVEVELEPLWRETSDGHTRIAVRRPPAIVADRLYLSTGSATFMRQVGIYDAGPERRHSIGQGAVYRVAGGAQAVDAFGAPLLAEWLHVDTTPARGRTLLIDVDNGDSPPLNDISVRARIRQPALVFQLEGPGVLRWGGGRVAAPHYDLEALFDSALGDAVLDEDAFRVATLGATAPNPLFSRKPALWFAARAGAALDASRFSHCREVVVPKSPDGLTRIALANADLATAKDDLGDVRLVDADNRQWPYLVRALAEPGRVRLKTVEAAHKDQKSILRLRATEGPLPMLGLELESDLPYLDRAYRLEGVALGGERKVLSEGRLQRRPGQDKRLTVLFGVRRLQELELTVVDGDDPPVKWRGVHARTPRVELLTVAAAGQHTLLLGAEAIEPPRYELERARELVLSVQAELADIGPLQANPSYAPPSVLTQDGGQTLALWAALILAVLVLSFFTLRLVRRESVAPTDQRATDE